MRPLHTITVGSLKALLADQPDDAPVLFTADYGDRSHTRQALGLRGDVETVFIEESGYSNSGFAIMDDESDTDENGDEPYLLIS